MAGELSALVVTAGAVVAGLGTVLAAIWWLVGPRITAELRELAAGAHTAQQQLDPDRKGSTAHHASSAAEATSQLPGLIAAVRHLQRQAEEYDQLRVAERLQLVEVMTENTDRRVAAVEQALIADLGHRRRHADAG